MVIQILPRDTRIGELGESITNLGQAAGAGLGYLIGSKISQVRARNAFESFGMDKQQANVLSHLPMQQRTAMLNDLAERRGYTEQQGGGGISFDQLQPQTQQRLAALSAMALSPQMGQIQQPQQALPVTSPMMQARQGAQMPLQQAQAAMAMGGPRGMLEGAQQGLGALNQARQQALTGYQPSQQQPVQLASQPPRQLGEAPRPTMAQPGQPLQLPTETAYKPSFAQIGQPITPYISNSITGPSPKYRAQMAKEARAERDLQLKEIEAQRKAAKDAYTMQRAEDERAWEFNKTEVKNIRDRAIESKEVIKSYDRLIKDAQSGNLRAGSTQQLLEKLGLDKFNQNLTTQQAAKEIARLAQGIGSSALGRGRITNYLEQTYQRALPTLWNTPQGIIMISRINKLDNQANIEVDNARKEIMKENGGKIPFDFVDQVYDRAEPRINALQEEALNIIDESIGNKRGTSVANTRQQALNNDQTNQNSLGGYLGVIPRAAEEIAGLPGNIVAGAAGLGGYIAGENSYTGQVLKSIQENAPTSEAIRRNITIPLTGEYFEPKTPGQELAQGFTSTAASLAAPLGPLGKGLQIGKAVKVAALGTGAQQAAAALGFGQPIQELAKAATILTGSMYGGRQQLRAVESKAYNTAREIAQDAKESAKPLSQQLNQLKRQVTNAAMDSNEQDQIKNIISSVSNNISKGKNPSIAINTVHDAKKQINDFIRNNEQISNTAKGFLAKIKQPLEGILQNYADKVPAFGKEYRLAEELHKAMVSNSRLTKFLNEATSVQNYLGKNPALKAALGLGSLTYLGKLPQAIVAAGAAVGTREASKLYDILIASPSARKHYLDLVKASQAGSTSAAMKALQGLNQEWQNQ